MADKTPNKETSKSVIEVADEVIEGKVALTPEVISQSLSELPEAHVELPTGVSPLELQVAQEFASGVTKLMIAKNNGITKSKVTSIINKPNISKFIQEMVREDFMATKASRQRLLNNIIEAKVAQIEEEFEGDYTKATTKDLLEVIEVYDKVMKEEEKAKLGTTDNTYVTLIQQILKD